MFTNAIFFLFRLYCTSSHLHPLIRLPLLQHTSLTSPSSSPSLQRWMSAILPPVLLFSDEANGGASIKCHQATLLLALHQSLYVDWLTGRGPAALLFLTFLSDPEVLNSIHPKKHISLCFTGVRLCEDKVCKLIMRGKHISKPLI